MLPVIKIIEICSKGTYICVFGEDIERHCFVAPAAAYIGGLGIERMRHGGRPAQRLTCRCWSITPWTMVEAKKTLAAFIGCAAVVFGPMPQQLPYLAPNRLLFKGGSGGIDPRLSSRSGINLRYRVAHAQKGSRFGAKHGNCCGIGPSTTAAHTR